MALDWTTMVNQVVIAGRPADVEDAALGWQELIGNVRDVCSSLERDIKGVDAFWTGKAADAFAERVTGVGKELKTLSDGAAPEGGAGIVDTLRNAAQDLGAAQAAMPVPASMLGELMAARDARITLAPGILEVELEAGVFNNAPMSLAGWLGDQFRKLLTDVEGDAREAYDKVSQQHETAADRAPAGTQVGGIDAPKYETPDLGGGGAGGGGGGGMPNIGGAGGGAGAGGFDMPKAGGSGVGNMPGLLDGSPIDKPDLGGFEPGSGLAGAGGGLATGTPGLGGLGGGGLGAGGLGAGGLGSGGGLGAGAGMGVPGGLGKISGGGSLGKPITPTIAPMGGGLAGKGGGGSGRGAGGRLGAGGMAGVGGMGGGAAGGGRGGGAARGGAGMAGMGGAGAGAGAGKGGAGKGAGGRGAGFAGGPGAAGTGHGDEDEYDSWLYEDENVWNEGSDVPPPPVLGN